MSYLRKIRRQILAARPKPVSAEQLKQFLTEQLYLIFHDKQAFGLIKRDFRKDYSLKDYDNWWFDKEDLAKEIRISSAKNTVTWEQRVDLSVSKEFYRFIGRQITKRIFPKLHDYGWYPLKRKLTTKPGTSVYFVLEPYYGERVTEVPKYVYHTTHLNNKEIILKKGLIPQQIGKISKHQNRVYVALTEESGHDFKKIMRFHGIQPEDYYYDGTYHPQVLFKIDTSKLRPGTKFYYDVEVPDKRAAWTYTHIPPAAISVLTEDESN